MLYICHFEPFSQSYIKVFVWLSLVLFSISHKCPDSWKKCWCSLSAPVIWFWFFSGRSVMGGCLGVMCITITLLLHPTPLLIFLAVACLNRLNPWTDWYIGACQRRCEELSLLSAVTAITLSHHHSTLPSPRATKVTGHKSLQTWEWGVLGFWGGEVEGECNTNLKEISPHA